MRIHYYNISRLKHKQRIKGCVLICLVLMIIIGWFTFRTVKTEASAAVSKKDAVQTLQLSKRVSGLRHIAVNMLNKGLSDVYIKERTDNRKNIVKPQANVQKKMVYLTFDDGPSKDITPQILDILNKYSVKASFFVIGTQCKYYPDMLIKEKENGSSICNHTYTHIYKAIYSSISSFDADVKKCSDVIKSILGASYAPKYVRFPGGGFGQKYIPFRNSVKKVGYTPVNWNIDTGDSLGKNVPSEKLIENVKVQLKNIPKGHNVIVLMHDMTGKQTTVEALPAIIEYLKAEGYSFTAFN
ncbi:MAG: polysaccharide deacetylase family protein [Bacteroidota bacterium]|nr:polysaccharide deacetylase family protein [Bacteroidota bacterium]